MKRPPLIFFAGIVLFLVVFYACWAASVSMEGTPEPTSQTDYEPFVFPNEIAESQPGDPGPPGDDGRPSPYEVETARLKAEWSDRSSGSRKVVCGQDRRGGGAMGEALASDPEDDEVMRAVEDFLREKC